MVEDKDEDKIKELKEEKKKLIISDLLHTDKRGVQVQVYQ